MADILTILKWKKNFIVQHLYNLKQQSLVVQ